MLIRVKDKIRYRGEIRGFELPEELCPKDPNDFFPLWERLRKKADVAFDKKNTVTSAGLTSVANIIGGQGTSAAVGTGQIFQQALGSANGPFTLTGAQYTGTAAAYTTVPLGPQITDTLLWQETYRKSTSALIVQTGPILVISTYFSPTEFWSWSSLVAASPAPTAATFSVNAAQVTPYLRPGDFIRYPTSQGYYFRQIKSISGSAITVYTNVGDVAPAVGAQVFQCIAEVGMFGDPFIMPANVPQGVTSTFTHNSTAVAGTGSKFTKNVASITTPGTTSQIRLQVPYSTASSPPQQSYAGPWYQIGSVTNDTNLTLSTNYLGDPLNLSSPAGSSYAILGTMFNHANNLNYVKLQSRGLVIENYWTLAGV